MSVGRRRRGHPIDGAETPATPPVAGTELLDEAGGVILLDEAGGSLFEE